MICGAKHPTEPETTCGLHAGHDIVSLHGCWTVKAGDENADAQVAADRVVARLRACEVERDAAREALRKYGHHLTACAISEWIEARHLSMRLAEGRPDCTCGLSDLVDRP